MIGVDVTLADLPLRADLVVRQSTTVAPEPRFLRPLPRAT